MIIGSLRAVMFALVLATLATRGSGVEKIIEIDGPENPEGEEEQILHGIIDNLHPLLTTELDFIRQTCDLTSAQRPVIRKAADALLKEVAEKVQRRKNGRAGLASPQQLIRTELAKVLKQSLTAEQLQGYSIEMAARTNHCKQSVILSLVSRVDDELNLTGEQREKIAESLSANWRDQWEMWLVFAEYEQDWFPAFVDKIVNRQLTPMQKPLWKSLPKMQMNQMEMTCFMQDQWEERPEDDEWWGVSDS